MVDTVRTISDLLTNKFQDAQGSFPITPNDMRDLIVTLQRRTPVINVMTSEYGAVGDGTTNDRTAINNAITACNTAGGGIVFFPTPPNFYHVDNFVLLKPGVTLMGEARSAGYFDGRDGYSGSPNTGVTCRIKPASWTGGDAELIRCDVTDVTNAARAKGYGAIGMIFDGNNLTSEVFVYSGASFIERFVTVTDCTFMASGGAGVRECVQIINGMLQMLRCNVFAGATYGIHFAPLTDSFITDCYIHSNASGGMNINNGAFVQIRGGKIEENLGPGISFDNNTSGLCQLHVYGVDFQHNTSNAIRAGGAGGAGLAYLKADHCVFAQNGYTGTLGPGAQILADTANGRLVADACSFTATALSKYHIGATNSGKVWHRNSVYTDTPVTAATFTATSGTITADGGSITTIA